MAYFTDHGERVVRRQETHRYFRDNLVTYRRKLADNTYETWDGKWVSVEAVGFGFVQAKRKAA